MKVLIILIVLAAITFGSGMVGYGLAVRRNHKAALSARERAELARLRTMSDELLRDSLDRVEVEPYAMVVLDTVRKYSNSIER